MTIQLPLRSRLTFMLPMALALAGAACGGGGDVFDGEGGDGGDGTVFDNGEPRLALGDLGSCLVEDDGAMWCWGWNQNGQFLTQKDTQFETPAKVELSVRRMALAGDYGCGLLGGEVRCRGYDHGGTEGSFLVGMAVDDLATGSTHVCALSGGEILCWGENEQGQLGDGTQQGRTDPQPVLGLANAIAVDVDGDNSCALDGAGAVWCWGPRAPGADFSSPVLQAVQVAGVSGALQLSVSSTLACVVDQGANVWCWADTSCPGIDGDCEVPTMVPGLTGVTQVAAGDRSACVRYSDGRVACLGDNHSGQLGTGNLDPSPTPVELPMLTGATALEMSGSHACARTPEGVYCWGANGNGQIGNGTTIDQLSPVKLELGGF